MKRLYSSRELAELFSVNESTIKRWADAGSIECSRTKGGHRRFPIQAVIRFVQETRLEIPELAAQIFANQKVRMNLVAGNIDVLVPRLKGAAIGGDLAETLAILRAGLASKPGIILLFEEVVFPVLRELGDEWEAGDITVDVEHLASQTIRDAIIQLQSSIHKDPPNGRTALLACFEGELHDIALLCAASVLQAEGWNVFNLGASTPTTSLLHAIAQRRPVLVLVSGRVKGCKAKYVRHVNQKMVPAVRRAGGKLAVGGPDLHSLHGKSLKADFISESLTDLERITDPKLYLKQR